MGVGDMQEIRDARRGNRFAGLRRSFANGGRRPETPAQSQRANDRLSRAVHRHERMSKEGLRERLFTLAFRGMVYPQIWEDPVVDMEALDIQPDSHIVTIASGGCNVLSYLTANPEKISAVDLNRAHVALNRLKFTAARELPNYEAFFRFFGEADERGNLAAYTRFIEPHLDAESRQYWERRDLMGRKRIRFFTRNVYRYGLLGTFIGAGHAVARLHGRNPKRLLEATNMDEQRALYDEVLAPLFDKRHIRWLANSPVTLYGLGIPPSQFRELVGDRGNMADVLKERLERLATGFPLDENYFAWQAFGRKYSGARTSSLPPYLQPEHYEAVRDRVDRVAINRISFTEFLANQKAESADRYILLDAQDWMTDEVLTDLWREVTRTARSGARVLFRTAGKDSILPGRVPDEILDRWDYRAEDSLGYTERDRSSVYGGVHLYVLKDA